MDENINQQIDEQLLAALADHVDGVIDELPDTQKPLSVNVLSIWEGFQIQVHVIRYHKILRRELKAICSLINKKQGFRLSAVMIKSKHPQDASELDKRLVELAETHGLE